MKTKTKSISFEQVGHVAISKYLVIRLLREHPEDLPKVLVDFKGTADEAIAKLEAMPYEFLTNPQCDNRAEDGSCAGHENAIA